MENEEVKEKFHKAMQNLEFKSKVTLLIAISTAIVLLLIILRVTKNN